jgi:hypothetical protein
LRLLPVFGENREQLKFVLNLLLIS